jgi:hypothetical protein
MEDAAGKIEGMPTEQLLQMPAVLQTISTMLALLTTLPRNRNKKIAK